MSDSEIMAGTGHTEVELLSVPKRGKKGKTPHVARQEPARIPVLVKGQKHVAPLERHSRQTHRRAAERAVAQGHESEKEQHAYDRSLVVGELDRRAALKTQQNAQNKVKAPVKPTTE